MFAAALPNLLFKLQLLGQLISHDVVHPRFFYCSSIIGNISYGDLLFVILFVWVSCSLDNLAQSRCCSFHRMTFFSGFSLFSFFLVAHWLIVVCALVSLSVSSNSPTGISLGVQGPPYGMWLERVEFLETNTSPRREHSSKCFHFGTYVSSAPLPVP